MPALTTHTLFAKKVLENLQSPLADCIHQHFSVFCFGAQGPDLFFFRKAISPLAGKNFLPKLGSRMHKEQISNTLNFMKSYLESVEKGSDEAEILISYYMGFICHYYLDKTVHPYVYFLQDSICHHHPERTPLSMHTKIESQLDTVLYELLEQRPISKFPLKEYFAIDNRSKNIIGKMYAELFKQVFDVEISVSEIMKCFDDLVAINRLLYMSTGILPAAAGMVGYVFPKSLDLTNQIKPKAVKEDVANFRENCWHHPKNPNLKYRKSVLSLFAQAKEQVVSVLEETYSQIGNELPVPFDTELDFAGNSIDELTD